MPDKLTLLPAAEETTIGILDANGQVPSVLVPGDESEVGP
jgi:hypothetical protein